MKAQSFDFNSRGDADSGNGAIVGIFNRAMKNSEKLREDYKIVKGRVNKVPRCLVQGGV